MFQRTMAIDGKNKGNFVSAAAVWKIVEKRENEQTDNTSEKLPHDLR